MAKTPEGKKKSSVNSLTHGLRSMVKILKDEKLEDYLAVEQRWMGTYAPRDFRETRMVEQLIWNDWFLQRAMRRLVEAESRDPGEEDYEHRLGLMQRYKITAERAFFRALGAVESLRKELVRNEREMAALAEKTARMAEKSRGEVEKTKKGGGIQLAEQWVEVSRDEAGKTVTTLIPGNEELRELVEALDPERDLVYRRFHFVDGVPEEYAWTTTDPLIREIGGAGIQRMRPETWFEQVEREAREGNGHLMGYGWNVPRPEERGGCDCPVCTENREWMEREEEEED